MNNSLFPHQCINQLQISYKLSFDIDSRSKTYVSPCKATLRKISSALKTECPFARDVGTCEGRWGTRLSQFLAIQLTLSQPRGRIMPPTLLLVPPDFQTFRHPSLLSRGYISQHLDPNLHGLAERASMAASCLHLPSKSHRSNKKSLIQLNLSIFLDA